MFLTKDLLLDWRMGEKYFADTLLDFDLASNNGGWQWSASTGCDAQPYFRVMNPYSQSERFDFDGEYIRKWVPELSKLRGKQIHHPLPFEYMEPIVDHAEQRLVAIDLFKKIK
jgi:deoxyribodipyrimidine photo-lyase